MNGCYVSAKSCRDVDDSRLKMRTEAKSQQRLMSTSRMAAKCKSDDSRKHLNVIDFETKFYWISPIFISCDARYSFTHFNFVFDIDTISHIQWSVYVQNDRKKRVKTKNDRTNDVALAAHRMRKAKNEKEMKLQKQMRFIRHCFFCFSLVFISSLFWSFLLFVFVIIQFSLARRSSSTFFCHSFSLSLSISYFHRHVWN